MKASKRDLDPWPLSVLLVAESAAMPDIEKGELIDIESEEWQVCLKECGDFKYADDEQHKTTGSHDRDLAYIYT